METAQLLRATATLLDCPCVEEVFPWALIPEHQLASLWHQLMSLVSVLPLCNAMKSLASPKMLWHIKFSRYSPAVKGAYFEEPPLLIKMTGQI